MPNTTVFTLDEIDKILEQLNAHPGARLQYIGSRYVPIFGRKGEDSIEWDKTGTYEPLTIVLYQGNSYTSRQFVPVGIEITNQKYWAETGNYNAQIEQYRQEVEQISNRFDAAEDKFSTVYDTVAAMKADQAVVAGTIVSTRGRNSAGDAGKAVYEIVAEATANDMDVIALANGLFAKNISEINIVAYGADNTGTTDAAAIINYAIQKARGLFNLSPFVKGPKTVYFPGGKYRIESTVTVSSLCKLAGEFVYVDSYASDTAFLFTASSDDYKEGQDGREEWFAGEWLDFIGLVVENKAGEDAVGFEIGSRTDLTTYYPTSRYTLSNFRLKDFGNAIQFNEFNNFIGTCNNFGIEPSKTAIRFIGGNNNSGERFSFSNFTIGGASEYAFYADDDLTLDAYFTNGSFDYNADLFRGLDSYVSLMNCHIESFDALIDTLSGDNFYTFVNTYIGFSKPNSVVLENFPSSTASYLIPKIVFDNCEFSLFGNYGDDFTKLSPNGAQFRMIRPIFRNAYAMNMNDSTTLVDSFLKNASGTIVGDSGTFTISDQTLKVANGTVENNAQVMTDADDTKFVRFTVTTPSATTVLNATVKIPCKPNTEYFFTPKGRNIYRSVNNPKVTFKFYDANNEEITVANFNNYQTGAVNQKENLEWVTYGRWGCVITPASCAFLEITVAVNFFVENYTTADYAGLYVVES